MKANKSKLRIFPILMILALMLTCVPSTALAATKNFSAIVKKGGMKVYRDSGLKKYWGKVPKNTVVKVKSYSKGIAKVSYKGKVGYARVDKMDAVEDVAKKAVTKKKTRVYKTASTKSKSVVVKKGVSMYVLSVNGNCARVLKNGVVGYIRKDHLIIGSGSASSGSNSNQSTQDYFDNAFAEQQQNNNNNSSSNNSSSSGSSSSNSGSSTTTGSSSSGNSTIESVFNSGKYDNDELCYAFLVKVLGYNHAAACGVIANIKYESGFKPGSIGDGGNSMGICQWNTSRKSLLINWCKDNGYDPETLLGQLYFLKYELEKRYPKIHKYLQGVADSPDGAYDAGYYFCYNFERPAKKETSSVTRGNYAKNTAYEKYKKL